MNTFAVLDNLAKICIIDTVEIEKELQNVLDT